MLGTLGELLFELCCVLARELVYVAQDDADFLVECLVEQVDVASQNLDFISDVQPDGLESLVDSLGAGVAELVQLFEQRVELDVVPVQFRYLLDNSHFQGLLHNLLHSLIF